MMENLATATNVLAHPLIPLVRRPDTAEGDLEIIEDRCRIKAEGARWTAARRRAIGNGASYQEIIERAKALEGCFLWMSHPSAPTPTDLRLWEDVAGCFEAAAMAVAVLRRLIEDGRKHRRFLEEAIKLVAEAQSALRMAVEMVDATPDNDQAELFYWLRHTAAESQIFVARYMQSDDPANPTEWNDLQARIGRLDSDISEIPAAGEAMCRSPQEGPISRSDHRRWQRHGGRLETNE